MSVIYKYSEIHQNSHICKILVVAGVMNRPLYPPVQGSHPWRHNLFQEGISSRAGYLPIVPCLGKYPGNGGKAEKTKNW